MHVLSFYKAAEYLNWRDITQSRDDGWPVLLSLCVVRDA